MSQGPGSDYTLTVMPRDTVYGLGDPAVCSNNTDIGPLCPGDPFYGQPTPGGACTGFLVDRDRVLTAGHCSPSAGSSCTNRYVVFDWAILDPANPPPSSGSVVIPGAFVTRCLEVLANAYHGPETDDLPQVPLNNDWAIWRVEPLPTTRLPLVADSNETTAVGEPVAMLGHPARILLKAEEGNVTASGIHGSADLHPVPGSSGSAVVSLDTGKVVGVATSGGMNFVEVPDCIEPGQAGQISNFAGPHHVTFQRISTLSALVPQVGLDINPPIKEVDHYGKPGDPGSFNTATFDLSVPTDTASQLPVSWYRVQEGETLEVTEVLQGPSAGTLSPGQQATLVIGPSQGAVQQSGLYQGTTPFFDTTYGTRSPVLHRVHSGVDGFVVFPADPFDGEGPGAPHGATANYRSSNRWLTSQSMKAEASDPWILLNGQSGVPQYFTIPQGSLPVPLTIEVDGSGMQPDVYVGAVTWTSLDSGQPPFAIQREVRMDLCRDVAALTPMVVYVDPNEDLDIPLMVNAGPGTTVRDLDVGLGLEVTAGGGGGKRGVYATVVEPGPDVATALLGENLFSVHTIYDDDTNPGLEPLTVFDGHQASGTWLLRLSHDATETLEVTIDRFEIRLHVDPSSPCV